MALLADTDLNKTFDVALHLGTLLGALVYFRRAVATYLRAFAISLVRPASRWRTNASRGRS